MVQVRNIHVDKEINRDQAWFVELPSGTKSEPCIELDLLLYERAQQFDLEESDLQTLRFKGREMVEILAGLNLDKASLLAALCLPYFEKRIVDSAWIEAQLTQEIRHLVSTVEQMQSISELQHFRRGKPSDTQIDTVRRMLLAMVEDVRAVLIKLAERICYLRIVKLAEEEERVLTAKECREIYAPLANRLGIGQLKWELEDLAFRYLNPDIYKKIAQELDEKRLQRESYIENFVRDLQLELKKNDVLGEVYGRPKHIFSIWKKMQNKNLRFEELYDIRAVRIITQSLKDCYGALGIVHSLWRHIASEFDDYIATPKANGYQSIHTVIIGPENKNIEIQIRSQQMHEDAELGVAAHWMYKEGPSNSKAQGYEDKIAWLRKLIAWHEDMAENEELIQEIRSQVFEDRVYVFTPKGDVIDLPVGSTPLDFAYYIHSQIGHRCIGAKVDGRIVPFTYQLQNGERVEVLTQKEANPKRDWMNTQLGYLASSRARSKVHSYFKKHDREHYLAQGREVLEGELSKHQLTLLDAEKAVRKFNVTSLDDLLVAIGANDVRLHQVVNYLKADTDSSKAVVDKITARYRENKSKTKQSQTGVKIAGIGNLMTNFAKCCQPLPGDPIVGFITLGRGVSVHHQDCDNVLNMLEQNPERGIDVSWSLQENQKFPVDLVVFAQDKSNLLHDITGVLSHEKITVQHVSVQQDQDGQALVQLAILMSHQEQIQRLVHKLELIRHVIKVQRRH